MTEPLTDSAFVSAIMDAFLSGSGQLVARPTDYAEAVRLELTNMPLSVALRGLESYLGRVKDKPWFHKVQLEWAHSDICDGFEAWKRSVGPVR